MRFRASNLLSVCLVLAIGVMVAVAPGRAARDLRALPQDASDYELVVLEVARCIYCKLFRRDVVPTYNNTTHAKRVPMRFVDLDHGALSSFQLTAPVETVPTVILLHRHREVGRVSGHVGPEIFLHALNQLLAKAP